MTVFITKEKLLLTTALLIVSTGGIVSAWNGLTASPGDTMSAAKWNELVAKIHPITSYGGENGLVGIGDTSPDHKLDVAGNIGLSPSAYVNFGDVDGGSGYGLRDNAGIIQFRNTGGTWTNVSGLTSVADGLWDHTATDNIALDTFFLSGDGDAEGIAVSPSGQVGIWTANPTYALDVVTNSNAQEFAMIRNLNSTGASVRARFTASVGGSGNSIAMQQYGDGSALANQGWVNTSGLGNVLVLGVLGSEKMRIDTAWKIGIGTASPSELLTVGTGTSRNVIASVGGYGDPVAPGASSNGDRITFIDNASWTTAIGFGSLNDMWFQSTAATGDPAFRFYTGQNAGGAPAERLRITSSGKVGIGTTTPADTLDVAGTIKVAGNGATCDATHAGAIRYNTSTNKHEGCNGTVWNVLY